MSETIDTRDELVGIRTGIEDSTINIGKKLEPLEEIKSHLFRIEDDLCEIEKSLNLLIGEIHDSVFLIAAATIFSADGVDDMDRALEIAQYLREKIASDH